MIYLPSRQGYYSLLTQAIANNFPQWMALRKEKTSIGQQFLNVFGMGYQDICRALSYALQGLYIGTADLNVADILFKSILPRHIPIDTTAPPTVVADNITITLENDLDTLLYVLPPTRGVYSSAATVAPVGVPFATHITYDLPLLTPENDQKTFYMEYDSGTRKFIQYYEVDETTQRPTEVPTSKEIILSLDLQDTNGNVITGTCHGFALAVDQLLVWFDNTVYTFDCRPLLKAKTDSTWVGNAQEAFLVAQLQTTITQTLGTSMAIDYDPTNKFFWLKIDSSYYKYELKYDYAIIDYDKRIVFFRERYTSCIVGGEHYDQVTHSVWNYFDEFGLLLDTPRQELEYNAAYKTRLLEVFKFRSNSTAQGVVNAVSRDLDLRYYGYLCLGTYPETIYPSGDYPPGYSIYASGMYPSGVYDIAKVNALYDPIFYSGYPGQDGIVDGHNIPTAEMVDYTREILRTFPIFWGSGLTDQYGFIWDLSPFDGGYNTTGIIPDFFHLLASGVDKQYFQSGIHSPGTDELSVRLVQTSNDSWVPEVKTGDFYIHNSLYHLYAHASGIELPAGGPGCFSVPTSGMVIAEPITVIDISGVVCPSGLEYVRVDEFTNDPYEYTFSATSGLVCFDEYQEGLQYMYETDPSGWYRIPGWDFNPTHALAFDGFMWISDQRQIIDASGGYTLTAIPSNITFGGTGSTLIGRLLDINGEAVIGADVYFNVTPSNVGNLTVDHTFTSIHGDAYSLYNPPTTTSSITTSGTVDPSNPNAIIYDATIATNDYDNVWTLTREPEASGWGGTRDLVWMEKDVPYDLAIQHSDWEALPITHPFYSSPTGPQHRLFVGTRDSDNKRNGTGTALANGDDFFNIRLDSVKVGGGQIFKIDPANLPTTGYAYDIDNYNNLDATGDYGKLVIYSVTIPTGQVDVSFDTYSPVRPNNIEVNIPSSGQTTVTYLGAADIAKQYLITYPLTITVESWAVYEGLSTLHKFANINMTYSSSQTGVFRLDDKVTNFISYLRYTDG